MYKRQQVSEQLGRLTQVCKAMGEEGKSGSVDYALIPMGPIRRN
jgi:hypothetical protein